jgi:short-subunit dehydrogenase
MGNVQKRDVAVITGASMGLGEEFARQLARRRLDLVLVARSGDRLEKLTRVLAARHGIRAWAMACDLTAPGAAGRVAEFLEARALRPAWLVNNAGFGTAGPFATMDPATVSSMITLNVTALVELTRALVPMMAGARDRRVINVASTAAFQPIPLFNVYAATKVFVLHFSEALFEELKEEGIRVTVVCPGPVPTKFAENNGLDPRLFNRGQSAREVVRIGLAASDKGRALCVTQRGWLIVLQRLMPRALVRWGAGRVARFLMGRYRFTNPRAAGRG